VTLARLTRVQTATESMPTAKFDSTWLRDWGMMTRHRGPALALLAVISTASLTACASAPHTTAKARLHILRSDPAYRTALAALGPSAKSAANNSCTGDQSPTLFVTSTMEPSV
jgi:hypothetical protein